MACCRQGRYAFKGKQHVQAFNKLDKKDKEQFRLNAIRGANDKQLNQRLASNISLASTPAPTNSQTFRRFVSGSLKDFIKKQILKSDYEELVTKYQHSNELWTDPDFPPTAKSWGDPKDAVIWRRASQVIQNPMFVSDNFTPSDILQGKIGNCYFLSAVAGLAEEPYRIKKLFPNTTLNKNGIYMARILHNGIYQQVVVDDYFPCSPNGDLMGAQPSGGVQIWVMILQKCWAKLFGSYEAIDGGLPHEVLHAFSAAPTYNYRVSNSSQQDLQKLWKYIYDSDKKGEIICCGTEVQTRKHNLQKMGLVSGHAYTILGAYVSPYRILKIRNPWGNTGWTGPLNNQDTGFWSKVHPEDQLKMGYNVDNVGDNGVFFIQWEDFVKYFVIVDICKINDNSNYFYLQNYFQKGKPVLFDLCTHSQGDMTITASQLTKRQLAAKHFPNQILAHAILVLAKHDGQGNFQYQNYSELYLAYPQLPPGQYVVCCFMERGDQQMEATISIYSDTNVQLLESKVSDDQYLHKVYLDHARRNQPARQIVSPNPLAWVCIDILTDNCGIGYSAFHLDPNSPKKMGLEFDQEDYINNSLQLMPPFKGAKKFKLICDRGQELIVLCRRVTGTSYISQFSMPTPKMYMLK